MKIVTVNCLGKKLGVAKGLKSDFLNDGDSIDNILVVDSITDDNIGVVLFSVMLDRVFGKFRITDLIKGIESGEINII